MNTNTPAGLVPCDKQRLLITDDEAPVRDIFRMIIADEIPGLTIDVAANGVEALQTFKQFRHGVLIMDLKMPIMDGQTAFYKIRDFCDEKGLAMPSVVFCTGFSPPSDILALANPRQKTWLIRKPVTSEVLLEAVKRCLLPQG